MEELQLSKDEFVLSTISSALPDLNCTFSMAKVSSPQIKKQLGKQEISQGRESHKVDM